MSETRIYCGRSDGTFHRYIEHELTQMNPRNPDYWWFPEIQVWENDDEIVARHPAQIVDLVPEMVGRTIVTMSEHIILAFQKMLRDGKIHWTELDLFCGDSRVVFDTDGDLEYWPGRFFTERLELLR